MHHLRDDIQEIADAQGWGEDSLLLLLSNFIHDHALTDQLAEYLEDAADDEVSIDSDTATA